MRINDKVPWHTVFAGFIDKPHLADPNHPDWGVFATTMLFVEAGMCEVDDQMTGRVELYKEGMEWARVTRKSIIDRAALLRADLRDERGKKVKLTPAQERHIRPGEGAFKYRWDGQGGMANFFMCMVRYACTGRRWGSLLANGPKHTLTLLPHVRSGELSLAKVIDDVGRQSLKRYVRLARCWLFPLLLTMDPTWRQVGNKARRELLDNYTARWTPVYERAIDELGVALRPDMDAARLSKEVANQLHGAAMDIAGKGKIEEGDEERFVHAVWSIIHSSLDPGDGLDMAAALTKGVARSRAGRRAAADDAA